MRNAISAASFLAVLSTILVLWGSISSAQEVDNAKLVKEFTANYVKTLESRTKNLGDELKAKKKGRIKKGAEPGASKGRYTFGTREQKNTSIKETATQLDELQQRVEALKSGKAFEYPQFDARKLNPETIGKFDDRGVNVFQVVDDKKVLIRLFIVTHVATGTGGGNNRFSTRATTRPVSTPVTVMVSGVSTKGMVDGKGTKLAGVFKVVGTETYSTTVGSNTVPVVKPFDTAKFEKTIK